ncbi:MAG: DinB family protein [Bacteroidota bacterium]
MKLIDDLKATQAQTLTYFDLSEERLDLRYGPGKWSIRQLLHHLADAETVLYERIRRAISKPNQVVWGFDQDAWAQGLRYTERPVTLNRAVFAAIRAAIIDLAERHYEADGANPYVHNETGKRTLKQEFDKVVWHNEHHLKQIEQALEMAKN